jgi:hypothetical protein
VFSDVANSPARVTVSPSEQSHPGFVMFRIEGNPSSNVDGKTIGFTAPRFGRQRPSFILKFQ